MISVSCNQTKHQKGTYFLDNHKLSKTVRFGIVRLYLKQKNRNFHLMWLGQAFKIVLGWL